MPRSKRSSASRACQSRGASLPISRSPAVLLHVGSSAAVTFVLVAIFMIPLSGMTRTALNQQVTSAADGECDHLADRLQPAVRHKGESQCPHNGLVHRSTIRGPISMSISINDQSQEVESVNIPVEYYSGVGQRRSWTEGSQVDGCDTVVPAGRQIHVACRRHVAELAAADAGVRKGRAERKSRRQFLLRVSCPVDRARSSAFLERSRSNRAVGKTACSVRARSGGSTSRRLNDCMLKKLYMVFGYRRVDVLRDRRHGSAGSWLIPAAIRVWACRSFIQDFMEENNVESFINCPGAGHDRKAR